MDFLKGSIRIHVLTICLLFIMNLHFCSSVKDTFNSRRSSVSLGDSDRNDGDYIGQQEEGVKYVTYLREGKEKDNVEMKVAERIDHTKISGNSSEGKHANNTQSVTQSKLVQNVSLTEKHPSSKKDGSEEGSRLSMADNIMALDYETDMSSPEQTFQGTSYAVRPIEMMETEAENKKSSLLSDHSNVTKGAEDRLDNNVKVTSHISETNESGTTVFTKTSEANENGTTIMPNTMKTKDTNVSLTTNTTETRQSNASGKLIHTQKKEAPSTTKTSAAEILSKHKDGGLKPAIDDRSTQEPANTKSPTDLPSSSTDGPVCSSCNETSGDTDSTVLSSPKPTTLNTDKKPTTSETPKRSPHQELPETGDDDVTFFKAGGDEEGSRHCPTCGRRGLTEDDVMKLRLDMFAGVLRQKLRLYNRDFSQTEEPAEQTLPKLPEVVKEQTFKDDRAVEEKYEFYARDEEIIITGVDIGHECIKMNANSTGCYTFDLKGNRVKRGIDSAFLWFYKTKDRHDVHKHELLLYELGLRRRVSGRLKEKSILARSEVYIKDGWVSMDLTIPVRKWVEQGGDKKILAIKCNTCATKHYKALYGVKEGYKPVLVIKYLKPKNDRREKRDSASCDPRTECCKRPLVADFDLINLHHIMRPKSLSIGFCYGYCDGIDQFTNNHTAVKQRMRWAHSSDSSLRDQLRSCCVPVVLKDASIITYEGGSIVRKILPNVIVERCGCL